MTYEYSLSGSLTEQKYPSGRVVKTTLDANGDLSQVQSKKNAGSNFATYASSFTYNPAGAIKKMQLGNSKWETFKFNERKQNSNEIYDAAGNIVDKTTSATVYDRYKFDAAGRRTETVMRYFQGGPQQTSFDRTQTMTQTFDGDGRSAKYVDHLFSRQIFPNNTYTLETTDYYVRSSVLGGKVLTELRADGTKKITNVYAGEAVLAEQVTYPASPGPPPQAAFSEVLWKHEDPVTGSFSKVNRGGAIFSPPEGLPLAEFEPLGGVIPPFDPSPPGQLEGPGHGYHNGGNIFQPEFGCAWDGVPIPCSLVSNVIRGSRGATINVNVRGDGGWGLYNSLQSQTRTWRYDVYAAPREGAIDRTPDGPNGSIRVNTNLQLLGSFYVSYISQFAETLIGRLDDTFLGIPARRLTEDETSTLRQTIVANMSPLCQDFVAQLINRVGGSLGRDPRATRIGALFDSAAAASGIWAFTVPYGFSHPDYSKNAIGLGYSNSMYSDQRINSAGHVYYQQLTGAAIAGLSTSERTARSNASIAATIRSKEGALTAIHELIHNALSAGGVDDFALATGALSFTGEELNLSGLSGQASVRAASSVWSDRLAAACGGQRRPGVEQYVRRR